MRVLLPNLVFTPDFTPYFGCGLYENAGSTTRYTVVWFLNLLDVYIVVVYYEEYIY